jgi:hypothetical protein
MDEDERAAFFIGFSAGVALTALVFGALAIARVAITEDRWKREAAAHGVAEYVVDGDDVIWRWKDGK